MASKNQKENKYQAQYSNEFPQSSIILPPGTQNNQNKYGTLTISVGKILYMNTSFPFDNTKIRVKFWGQDEAICLVAQNCAKELKAMNHKVTYEIRSPVALFHLYLKDMVRLKLDVLDKRNDKIIGIIIINLLQFLKKSVSEKERNVFDQFNGVFPIMKPQLYPTIKPSQNKAEQDRPMVNMGDKIGEIEINLSNMFFAKEVKVDVGDYEQMRQYLENEKNLKNDHHPDSQQNDNKNTNVADNENYFEKKQREEQERQQKKQEEINIKRKKLMEEKLRMQQQEEEKEGPNSPKVMNSDQKSQNVNIPIKQKYSLLEESLNPVTPPFNQKQLQGENVFLEQKPQEKQNNLPQKQNQKVNDNNNQNQNSFSQQNQLYQQQPQQQQIQQQPLKSTNQTPSQIQRNNSKENENLKQSVIQKPISIIQPQLSQQQQQVYQQDMSSVIQSNRVYDAGQEEEKYQNETQQLINKLKKADIELIDLHLDEVELFQEPKINYNAGFLEENDELKKGFLRAQNLKDIDKMRVRVFSFRLGNPIYKQRFKDKKVFIEIEVPGLNQSQTQIVYNKYTLEQKAERNQEWLYNQEFPQMMRFAENNLQKILENPIKLKIFIEDHRQERMFFGQGKFKLETLILEEQLKGQFVIQIVNPEIPIIKKSVPTQLTEQDIGEILLEVTLESQKKASEVQQELKKIKQRTVDDQICSLYIQLDYASEFVEIYEQNTKLYIRYKLLSNNEQVETEPQKINSAENSVEIDHKCVQPIFSETIHKVQKIPYIIEIWKKNNSDENQQNGVLVGMCRLNLQAIFLSTHNTKTDDFSLEQIQQNPSPLFIFQEDDVEIQNLKIQQKVGNLRITIAFGTIQQINKYEEKLRKKQKLHLQSIEHVKQDEINLRVQDSQQIQGDNLYSPSQVPHQQQQQQLLSPNQMASGLQVQQLPFAFQYDKFQHENKSQNYQHLQKSIGSLQNDRQVYIEQHVHEDSTPITGLRAFLFVMEQIRRNKRKSQQNLKNFVVQSEKQDKKVSLRELYNFLTQLPFHDTQKESYIQKLIQILDFSSKNEIYVPDFSKSFNSYLSYEEIIRDQMNKIILDLLRLMKQKKWSSNDMNRQINRYSEFGFIQKQKFIQFLSLLVDNQELTEQVLYVLDPNDEGLISTNSLIDYLKNAETFDGLSQFNNEQRFFIDSVIDNLEDYLFKNKQVVLDFMRDMHNNEDSREYDVRQIIDIIESLGLEITFWEALCIIQSIKDVYKMEDEPDEWKISAVALIDYFDYLINKRLKKGQQNQLNSQSQLQNQEDEALEIAAFLKQQK